MSHAPAHESGGGRHPSRLAHHFETPGQQMDSAKMGMWIFLATEILLFGGLFCAYSVYRAAHPEIFLYAHQFLDKILGGINTVVLLCSSFTMAWAVRSAQLGHRRALAILLSLTLLGGCGFLGIKYVEYKQKWEHGLLWGRHYHPTVHPGAGEEAGATSESGPAAPEDAPPPTVPTTGPGKTASGDVPSEGTNIPPAPPGPRGTANPEAAADGHGVPVVPRNVQLFFAIYFLMTGLHGLHVLAGMAAIAWVLRRSVRGEFGPAYFAPVDLVGLYWHLVDLIWIFLFPLLYLIH